MAQWYCRFVCLAVALAVLGCGDGSETLYDVSGTIKYDGKAIPKGMVYFEPTAAKGTTAHMGYAEIVQGKFDTKLNGKGVRPGPYQLRISGYDGVPAEEAPYGQALFSEYTTTKEFSAEPATLDIDIPKKRKND